MNFNDDFFGKVEKKTKVNKETLINLAKRLNENNMKDEKVLSSIIQDLSQITGKKVSKETEEKIIQTIKDDKVPTGVENMF